jgi:predicted peptidase
VVRSLRRILQGNPRGALSLASIDLGLSRRDHWVGYGLASAALALAIQFIDLAPYSEHSELSPGIPGAVKIDSIQTKTLAKHCFVCLPSDYYLLEQWPIILYLHGSGDRGDNIKKLCAHGLPKRLCAGLKMHAIVAAPQCKDNFTWNSEELNVLLDLLEQKFAVDPDRVYVVGESMGGYGAWRLAQFAPERLAALIPLCGGGDVGQAKKLSEVPIWAFHGEKDRVVPLEESQRMVDAVADAGGNAILTILPGRGHNLRDVPWENEELIRWMLNQKRRNSDAR